MDFILPLSWEVGYSDEDDDDEEEEANNEGEPKDIVLGSLVVRYIDKNAKYSSG
jgi:hypothetical protein